MPIYIVSHLRLKRTFDKDFRVIYVGPLSDPSSPDDFAVTDAIQSPHMADKNKSFCELTALYQMLNLHAPSKDELIGLVHYRRPFVQGPKWLCRIIRTTQKSKFTRGISNALLANYTLTQSKAAVLLKDHDVIVPVPVHLKTSVEERYMQMHVASDWEKLKRIIEVQQPDYLAAFEQLANGRSMYLYNMFVGRTELMHRYAKWLFPILESLETQIDISDRDTFQKRVFGFLAERLFNVFLIKHTELKVLHLPVVQLFNESVVAT
jgi:hypothetical protein